MVGLLDERPERRWSPQRDLNPHGASAPAEFGSAASAFRHTASENGGLGGIRTPTRWILSPTPLPNWATSPKWRTGTDSNRRVPGLQPGVFDRFTTRPWVEQRESNPPDMIHNHANCRCSMLNVLNGRGGWTRTNDVHRMGQGFTDLCRRYWAYSTEKMRVSYSY